MEATKTRIMATGFQFLWFSFFTLLSSTVSIAKTTPRFPSSVVWPEQLSRSNTNQLYKTKYFTQILDHFNFNPQSYQTFQQRMPSYFKLQHRFYGKSMPFGGVKDVAYRNGSTLGYLSSTQALADYATLITNLKQNLTATDSPVIVFGGSYGGMLAAWFRLKYPHITSSARRGDKALTWMLTSPFI